MCVWRRGEGGGGNGVEGITALTLFGNFLHHSTFIYAAVVIPHTLQSLLKVQGGVEPIICLMGFTSHMLLLSSRGHVLVPVVDNCGFKECEQFPKSLVGVLGNV